MSIQFLEDLRSLIPDVMPDVLEIRGEMYEQFHRRLDEDDWKGMPQATCVHGGAGGGKTLALSNFVDRCCRRYPGLSVLILRENFVDLATSWKRTFEEEVLDADDPYDQQILEGRDRDGRKVYTYPVDEETGLQSTITCGGMNMWERFRSTQFHIIHIVEGTEVSKFNTQGVVRALRPQRKRGLLKQKRSSKAKIPFRPFLVIDTNPDAEDHHLNVWMKQGRMADVQVTIKDNPLFWDRATDSPTKDGRDYLGLLTNNTDGHVHDRLVRNLWTTAVGAIFTMWDPRVSLFQGRFVRDDEVELRMIQLAFEHPVLPAEVELVDVIAAQDWGTRNAGAFLVFGVDREARLYLLHEVYHTQRDIDWWADHAVRATLTFGISAIVCDTDKPDNIVLYNRALHRAGIAQQPTHLPEHVRRERGSRHEIARRVKKNTTKTSHVSNVEIQRWMMKKDPTGRPHFFASADSLVHAPDPELVRDSKPTRLTKEIPAARWAEFDPGRSKGKPKEEIDPSCHEHALTCVAYAGTEVYGRDLAVEDAKERFQRKPRRGSWDELFEEQGKPQQDSGEDDDFNLYDDERQRRDLWR